MRRRDPRKRLRGIGKRVVREAAPARAQASDRARELHRLEAHEESRREALETQRELERLARGATRFVCGPWHSEIGFEVLYWIPFLRRFQRRYGFKPKHFCAISRGGASPWYSSLAEEYVDVFDVVAPDEFRELQQHRVGSSGSEKQMSVTELDREILDRTRDRVKKDAVLLHPSLMYRLLWPVWTRRMPIAHWQHETHYEPLRAGGIDVHGADLSGLPADYVAVKLYFSDCLPETAENRALLQDLLARLAERTNVVLLSTGLRVDDHSDFRPARAENVWDVQELMRPTTNLALQTDLIRGAKAFFSTYGGFSYLGPFLGVPTLSLYSLDNFNPTHLDVMRRTMQAQRGRLGADFTILPTEHLALTELLGGLSTTEVAARL